MDSKYMKKAEQYLPNLISSIIKPIYEKMVCVEGDSVVIDLGNHYVGYFSFVMDYVDFYLDAPVRMQVRFCETERELEDDYSEYNGTLCPSWFQEEIITVDFPGVYKMPRRYAVRYIKITILNAPKKLALSDFTFESVTSADVNKLLKVKIEDNRLTEVDCVSVNTLKNCMQRVFEDGPKRDRRLWIGDLRLEALTNYYTFRNLDLVKRCLYLFAAAEKNENGFVPSCVYENPVLAWNAEFLTDYALLYVVSVCEYYEHTGDKETFIDLYDTVKSQVEAAHNLLDSDGIMTACSGWFAHIDWCPGLKLLTSLHGVYLYTLDILTRTLKAVMPEESKLYEKRLNEGRKAALYVLYDCEKKAFVNDRDEYQYSIHSAVWMILGGVVIGDEAKRILMDAFACEDCIRVFTPYMHHYVLEAMIKVGMLSEAFDYIKDIWGGMLDLGADTFFEVYVPGKPEFSPYGDRAINSMCHAWSCTPSYFIRKYL